MQVNESTKKYLTAGGIQITRTAHEIDEKTAVQILIQRLDSHLGMLMASNYEVPGRYTRWEIGFIDPPLVITSKAHDFEIRALNQRGHILLPTIDKALKNHPYLNALSKSNWVLRGRVKTSELFFEEEQRSRQPSIFSIIRSLVDLFSCHDEPYLGLYGAFGYDLVHQFEPLSLRLNRPLDHRDLVLYLPDQLLVVDHHREIAQEFLYEFSCGENQTQGLERLGSKQPFIPNIDAAQSSDHGPGEYENTVRRALDAFDRGDLFEVVPSQTFFEPCTRSPSSLFKSLRHDNPSPFGFFINLGEQEYLVGASPEMYVRVTGDRVETCPIAGTISRGSDALGDATQIRQLLNSPKDEAELTMCTDVDRNDKARICCPGSVQVIGRRLVEVYSKLIHTVDHVQGRLRPGYDAFDAFVTHCWAVTVTGAPKRDAMQFIEDHERSPRAWYAGAVGLIGFNGDLNTGLVIRTIRIKDGIAQVRAGATLLSDSIPEEEYRETQLKAAALVQVLRTPNIPPSMCAPTANESKGCRVMLVDHRDSFVHMLADYFRQQGSRVTTLRSGFDHHHIDRLAPHLVVLSPGPGLPRDFGLQNTIAHCMGKHIPIFGVCLGLQGIVEYYGGDLELLSTPMHGKTSRIQVLGGSLFHGIPQYFTAGRYHSLHAKRDTLPESLRITATSDDGTIMAVEHKQLPLWATQFHPESIMTASDQLGNKLIANVVQGLTR